MHYRHWILFSIPLLLAIGLFAEESPTTEQPDPKEIVRQVAANYRRDIDAARDYTYRQRSAQQQFDKKGSLKSASIRTWEVSVLFGQTYGKLIAIDDKPLSETEQKREEERLNKFFDKRKEISDEDRTKQTEEENRRFQREIADELPQMLNYEIIGEEIFDGKPVWVIQATSRKDYKPQSRSGKMLSKLSGKVWITKTDLTWVKLEANLEQDFSVGWFLFKLHKGTRIEAEYTLVNEDTWLPRRTFIDGGARLAWSTIRFISETTYSQYQKFTSDVKVMFDNAKE